MKTLGVRSEDKKYSTVKNTQNNYNAIKLLTTEATLELSHLVTFSQETRWALSLLKATFPTPTIR